MTELVHIWHNVCLWCVQINYNMDKSWRPMLDSKIHVVKICLTSYNANFSFIHWWGVLLLLMRRTLLEKVPYHACDYWNLYLHGEIPLAAFDV